ncbi:MAG: UbiH/UbiF family hydroxylase [Rhizobiaceae bacterium]
MTELNRLPIIVAGTGPAGLIAALAVADRNEPVVLLGPLAAGQGDRRTTAIMGPSLMLLERLGLAEALASESASLQTMRIVDATSRLVRAPAVTFRASEIGEEHFGLNIPNAHLNAVLEDAVARQPLIQRHEAFVTEWVPESDSISAGLEDGSIVSGCVAIAADGRNSPAREAAGIRTRRRDLPQTAVVLNFAHTRGHGNVSTEFHTETGPFTQVPLPGNRSSLVWVVRPETADELVDLDDEALSLRIEERMQSMLGRVTVEAGRQTYPLASVLPHRYAARRIMLVGEAGHVFAPIGAQGLNLGIRDVECVLDVLAKHSVDPGSEAALAAYDRRRRPDVTARSGTVALLNRSLLSDLLPWQLARSAGLGVVDAIGPLRAFLMREGMRPGSGLSGILRRSPEQVGR